jgi:hypothetical protein
MVKEGKLKIVASYYDRATGKVGLSYAPKVSPERVRDKRVQCRPFIV